MLFHVSFVTTTIRRASSGGTGGHPEGKCAWFEEKSKTMTAERGVLIRQKDSKEHLTGEAGAKSQRTMPNFAADDLAKLKFDD